MERDRVKDSEAATWLATASLIAALGRKDARLLLRSLNAAHGLAKPLTRRQAQNLTMLADCLAFLLDDEGG